MRRFFERIEQKGLIVNRFRADCGSCSEEIVEEVGKHCKTFYIRANRRQTESRQARLNGRGAKEEGEANRCGSLYDDIFALRGWKKEEFNGIEFELASILVEKWKGRAYRLVIQRQKRIDGELDLWKANTPTAASLQMTTSLPRKRLLNSITSVEGRNASSMT